MEGQRPCTSQPGKERRCPPKDRRFATAGKGGWPCKDGRFANYSLRDAPRSGGCKPPFLGLHPPRVSGGRRRGLSTKHTKCTKGGTPPSCVSCVSWTTSRAR